MVHFFLWGINNKYCVCTSYSKILTNWFLIFIIYFKGGMGMPQGNIPGQMQLSPGPNMPGGPGSNQMPGLMPNSALTASLQNQPQANLGN